MDALETYEHAGCTIEIHYDDQPTSPREWTQLGTILTWGRERGWGDEARTYEPMDTHYSWPRWAAEERRSRGATVILPVWNHGNGVRVGTQADWFTGIWGRDSFWPSGCIFDTAKGRDDCGTPAELIEAGLGAEIDEMNVYFAGEVYGYTVKRGAEQVGSCWGFFGDEGMAEAKADAESEAEHEALNAAAMSVYESKH